MNKTAIKTFGIWARLQLLEAVKQRAYEYGVTEAGVFSEASEEGRVLWAQVQQRGFEQVMEEAAYTWFNRFIALRYMEVNGFLPSKVRVFTDEKGDFKPQILKEALSLEGVDRNKVLELLERQDNEGLYRYLLINQCNALNRGLPQMFETIDDETELLFPANLLRPDSVVGQMVAQIPQEDWLDGVQIIGWLYQYYNSDRKDDTFALLKQNVKITKERIPAATQLFTPEWIVRYLVENSVGRIYVNHQLSLRGELTEAQRVEAEKDLARSMGWDYYLADAPQSAEVRQQLMEQPIRLQIQEVKVIDPCMGSGHILVYAFDVLMQIYRALGWSERDAARSILEHNLYGLDIDDRAGQLSYFAVMMKARKYNRRILKGEISPHVFALREGTGVFENAKEYGSLLRISPEDAVPKPLKQQADLLSQQYDVVVTNPPYMGIGGMSPELSAFVRSHYPDSKRDLCAVFLERCAHLVKPGGYQAMITQHSWMFLRSFEKLRGKVLGLDTVNLIHLGPRAFEEIPGDVVQTVAFVLRSSHTEAFKTTYCRLTEPTTPRGKEELFLSGDSRYYTVQMQFAKIPGSPIAYWLTDVWVDLFERTPKVGAFADCKQGIATADNQHYLRLWHECAWDRIYLDCTDHECSAMDERKWYPYNKGGESRKWYGNQDYVINWQHDGQLLRADPKAAIRNPNYFFRQSVSWSLIFRNIPAFRLKPRGQLFDVAGMSCFSDHGYYLLALFNSNVAFQMLKVLAPTINYQCGDIANLPLKLHQAKQPRVEELAKRNVELCKEDWDAFEVSWDFQKHPLI